jgi:hypothetical protein
LKATDLTIYSGVLDAFRKWSKRVRVEAHFYVACWHCLAGRCAGPQAYVLRREGKRPNPPAETTRAIPDQMQVFRRISPSYRLLRESSFETSNFEQRPIPFKVHYPCGQGRPRLQVSVPTYEADDAASDTRPIHRNDMFDHSTTNSHKFLDPPLPEPPYKPYPKKPPVPYEPYKDI